MAYLRELQSDKCDRDGCHRKRVVEVLNRSNSSYGKYCRKHGAELLRRLKAEEGEIPKRPAQ